MFSGGPSKSIMFQSLYDLLYVNNNLKITGLILGVLLLSGHVVALFKPVPVQRFLIALPRNRQLGLMLLAVAAGWALLLVSYMDMGEFYTWRNRMQLIVVAGFVLVARYVEEFISVRALGCLLLLVATPVLEAAFLKQPVTRLLLPTLAYAWVLLGMFWIGMPYLMRDLIAGVTRSPGRWLTVCLAGAAYGAAILVCAVLYW